MGDVIVGVGHRQVRTGTRDYTAMLGYVRQQWPRHRWAIEGA